MVIWMRAHPFKKKTIGSHLISGSATRGGRSKVPGPPGRAAAASGAMLKVKLTRGLGEGPGSHLAAQRWQIMRPDE